MDEEGGRGGVESGGWTRRGGGWMRRGGKWRVDTEGWTLEDGCRGLEDGCEWQGIDMDGWRVEAEDWGRDVEGGLSRDNCISNLSLPAHICHYRTDSNHPLCNKANIELRFTRDGRAGLFD